MIEGTRPLLLGSASPRRREILTALGIPLIVRAVDLDESVRSGENAADYLARITLSKLEAVAAIAPPGPVGAILVADTIVLLEGEILGKPRDEADSRAMLRALSGHGHQVRTRFAIAAPAWSGSDPPRAPVAGTNAGEVSLERLAAHAETVQTKVWFRTLDDDEIVRYAATGEGRDKAGAYAIQGIGAFAVERIEGSYSNVVGLPACEVVAALLRTKLLAHFPFAPAAGP